MAIDWSARQGPLFTPDMCAALRGLERQSGYYVLNCFESPHFSGFCDLATLGWAVEWIECDSDGYALFHFRLADPSERAAIQAEAIPLWMESAYTNILRGK